MNATPFPELDNEAWDRAHESAAAHGLQGLTRALHLTVNSIANARSQIGGGISHLKGQIEVLNSKLDEFNKSSEQLTQKALSLTKWIMWATIVSAIATLILAFDIVFRWFGIKTPF
ncbi:MAG: hypothetical protein KGI50_01570 [Patescibacteria group bacterium]|nr:hypothetical protein [Patescibacteria group bacterium]MDE2437968.1 hypothetical protein [Patescibacteria group bacterium]